jgi:hypothetical protein
MAMKDVLKKIEIQPRDLGRTLAERANDVLNDPASIDDRVVSIPDPDEQEPKTQNRKPIVSIRGEDVDFWPEEKGVDPPEDEQSAA